MLTQRSRSPMGHHPHGGPGPYMNDPNYLPRPHTSDGRRSPYSPGPSRSPNPQQHHRPDQPRHPPHGGAGGPPPHYQGRGRPPSQRPPPGHGPPYQGHGTYGRGPGPRPFAGPQGRGGPPPNAGQPQRKPLPAKAHHSLTPNDIIEHYLTDTNHRPPPGAEHRPPPPHKQGPGLGGPDNRYGEASSGMNAGHANGPADGSQAGVLKTVGGGEPPAQQRSEFDLPDVDFGSTINYGAAAVLRKKVPESVEAAMADAARRQHPPGQGPSFTGHPPPGLEPHRARQDLEERGQRAIAWQPGGSHAGPGSPRLTAEQYGQQRRLSTHSSEATWDPEGREAWDRGPQALSRRTGWRAGDRSMEEP